LTILVIPGEEHKLWSSSLCSFFHPLVTWALFSKLTLKCARFYSSEPEQNYSIPKFINLQQLEHKRNLYQETR
jgi:hypothetical protein